MVAAVYMSLSSVQPTTGYTVRAVAQIGDNDGTGGDNELLLGGTTWQSYVGGQMTWNPTQNPDGSWSSGLVPFQLAINAGGGVQLYVPEAAPEAMTDNGASYEYISSVAFTAGAQAQGSFSWSDVQVRFSNGSTTTDTYFSAAGLTVDTTTATDPDAENLLTLTSDTTGNTSVIITGYVSMTTPSAPYLNASDLFGEVLIYTSATA